MKKVFFTVSALVAFSAASMANTIEVKKEVVPVKETKKIPMLYCMVQSFLVFAELHNAGVNDEDCFAEMNSSFNDCAGI